MLLQPTLQVLDQRPTSFLTDGPTHIRRLAADLGLDLIELGDTSNLAPWWRSAVRPISTASCVGQGRRGSLGAGIGYCHLLVRPSWCRSSADLPIRCSGGLVSIWTTNRKAV